MSTATVTPEEATAQTMTAGQLPRFTTWGVLLVSLAVAGGILAALGSLGPAGTIILGGLIFLIAMHVVSLVVEGNRRATDRTAFHLVTGAFLLALAPLVSLIISTIGKGLSRLDAQFFTYSMRNVVGEGGGAVHAIYGTLIVTGLATLISLPIGMFTAIFLVEYGNRGRLARSITFFVDVMTGIPSIVAGLFAYALVALIVGPGTKMGLAGAIALSVLMIPTVVRSTEEMLRLVPNDLRESSYALGVPKWKTITKIVLPTSIAGIITGAILAVARVIGETAPLLVTAGLTASLNTNPVEGPMTTLPVYVYYQYMTPGIPQDPFYARAWTGALTLVAIVMVLNLIGRLLAWKFAPKGNR
ncbi:phosphate ABC transporter permease PstA [Luteococcus sp. OSA5]|uniref:phosphate ABC transporter permease PstA n=1 Tax=Luteococcus sp. OSA5 TaxID=3401630 RepID=UPI003B42AAA4